MHRIASVVHPGIARASLRRSIALLLLAGAGIANAGTLHVCVDARGIRSYQDIPCAPQAHAVGTREYDKTTVDPALAARTRAIEAEMDRRNRAGGGRIVVAGGGARRPPAPSACEAAKAKRKATLDRVGLKRNFDLLSQLDGEVWSVCKGF